MIPDRMKLFQDYILTTKDTIFILQNWLSLLERWQVQGQLEPGEFDGIYGRLCESGLGNWVEEASGHDLDGLRQAVDLTLIINEEANIEVPDEQSTYLAGTTFDLADYSLLYDDHDP